MTATTNMPSPNELAHPAPTGHDAVAQSLDLRLLHRYIARMLNTSLDSEQLLANAIAFVAKLTNAHLVVYFAGDTNSPLCVAVERRSSVSADYERQCLPTLTELAAAACTRKPVAVQTAGGQSSGHFGAC